MKNIFVLILTCLLGLYAVSQNQAANWYFGYGAGISFNDDGTVNNLTDGRLRTIEGCTTISDEAGNLLFYTDGITVYNKNHQAMPSANGRPGNILFGDPSSTQSAIIIPKPKDPNIYYIFTVDTVVSDKDVDTGFNYSIVDLSLDGGLGDIVSGSRNINLLEDSSEKLSAVLKGCDSESIWVITFAPLNGISGNAFDSFYAYEVSSTGINTTPVVSTFTTPIGDQRGYLKLSPDGSKIACANSISGLFLYDFDKDTGKVSNETEIIINELSPVNFSLWSYGVEFSPNSNLLYVSAYFNTSDFSTVSSALLQYNLAANDISGSEFLIDKREDYRGALQLGPNGKIYKAMSNNYDLDDAGIPFLSVINNPNEIGVAANYQHNSVTLTRNSRQGLPPFVTSFFTEKIDIIQNNTSSTYLPLCIGESYTLKSEEITMANYIWTKDDVILPENSFELTVTEPGFYKVSVESNSGSCGVLFGEALVEYFEVPNINQPDNILICDVDNDGNYDFDFSIQDNDILGSQDPNNYKVSYHLSQDDADLNQNEIVSPYNNNSISPQEIFIRLQLEGNSSCYDTKSFITSVFSSPIANNVSNDFIICDYAISTDLNVSNGQTNIDLHQFDEEIYGTQNITEYSISYYSSFIDAENKNAPLNFNYYNLTPFNESIFARIENNLNSECFDISGPINIIVNPLPEFTNTRLLQCDEDGLKDNVTIYNLSEAETKLTNSVANRSVLFYESIVDAEFGENQISTPEAYQNTTNPQVIYARIIDTATNCFNIAELVVETSSTQINNFNAPPVCDEFNSEDGLSSFNLDDFTADIQIENNITFPINYYESYQDALSESNTLSSNYRNTVPYSQTIYARAENNNNCYGIAEILLTVNKLPDLEDDTNTYYCINTYPKTITLNAGLLNSSQNNYSYAWSNGDTSYETDINEIGTYNVTVTNVNGCSKDRSIVVQPSDLAAFSTSIPFKINDARQNNQVTVFVTGDGTYQFSLIRKSDSFTYPYQDSNTFENIKPGIYTAGVRDIKNNCGIAYKDVAVVGFPKFFTPNNDGVNDTWQVYGISEMFQPNSKIMIFNRYGKLIKEITPMGNGWDGLLNGKLLPEDDYWFSVTLQDGRIFKNHFTLKR